MNNNSFFDLALKMFSKDEDIVPFPYDDKIGPKKIVLPTGGKITIGIGRNLSDVPLSPEEILYLFNNDLSLRLVSAREVFSDFDQYSTNRRLGIINLLFNLGLKKFLGFQKTIEAIKLQDWELTGSRLRDSLWYQQVGERGPRVVKLIEKDLYVY